MKSAPLLFALAYLVTLSGCSNKPRTPDYMAISAPIAAADSKLEAMERQGARAGDPTIKAVRKDLKLAADQVVKVEANYTKYESWAEIQIADWKKSSQKHEDGERAALLANDAIAARWHKIAIGLYFLAPFIFWGSSTAAKSSPYTAFLPSLVTGFAGLIVFGVIAFVLFEIWSAFGRIWHLLFS